jgi:hypothetical protein
MDNIDSWHFPGDRITLKSIKKAKKAGMKFWNRYKFMYNDRIALACDYYLQILLVDSDVPGCKLVEQSVIRLATNLIDII